MNAKVPAKSAATVSGGTAAGLLTFAANGNDGFYPGAFAYLMMADGSDSQYCRIVELVGTTQVKIRFETEPNLGVRDPKIATGTVKPNTYGYSSAVAFLTGSVLAMHAQAVEVTQPLFDPIARANH